MKPSAVILNAMKLIATPKTWIKHDYAKSKHGTVVDSAAKDAVWFCLSGAISCAGTSDFVAKKSANLYINQITYTNFNSISITSFNDVSTTGHKKVMRVMMAAAFHALADEK